jgi:hypothetical protein
MSSLGVVVDTRTLSVMPFRSCLQFICCFFASLPIVSRSDDLIDVQCALYLWHKSDMEVCADFIVAGFDMKGLQLNELVQPGSLSSLKVLELKCMYVCVYVCMCVCICLRSATCLTNATNVSLVTSSI